MKAGAEGRKVILFLALWAAANIFIAGASGDTIQNTGTGEDMSVVIPSALRTGDKVGIIMPAGRAAPERLRFAVDFLIDRGFRVVFSGDIDLETDYGVGDGSEKARADAFNRLARNPDIKAIFCLRGGYGSMHLLRNIDYEALRRNRPIIVGYSDITALNTAIVQKAGLMTFHGPMLSSNYGQKESFDLLFDLLMNPSAGFPVKNIDGTVFSVINEGTAEGIITGGNLTLINSLMGTEYEIDLKDKILFIEDLDEAPYRLHRYIWQLKLAGKLDEVAAVVIGDILPDEEYDDPEISLKVVLEALKDVNAPILYNVRAGHGENPLTIPIGARVRIEGREIKVIQEVVEAAGEMEDGGAIIKTAVLERVLRYVSHDTQSDPNSDAAPSTEKQTEFAKILAEECKAAGLSEVVLNGHGIVTATLPSNIEAGVPVIGFIAHMDTSPDASGQDVIPRVFENYDGKDIVLNAKTVISPDEFPDLKKYAGQTIITASGGTLLGADDKAGIAIILTAMEHLLQNPQIPRGKIRIAFTPDEEIGRGTVNFDIEAFGADFAFTVDGGALGELTFENFNAAKAQMEITGRAIHPGSAKGIMKNAALIATELASAFPANDTPANTEGYEGFYHLTKIEGHAERAVMEILIRSFDGEDFEARKKFVAELADDFNGKYGENTVKLDMTDQYYNMKDKIDPEIIKYAKAAFAAAGVKPDTVPARGGTDGAALSHRGLPCPNIFTGGYNSHGPYEFIPLESMEKAVGVVVNLASESLF